MTVEYLPDGGALVTVEDDPVWTPLDVFTWVAFGERRGRATLPKIIFPPNEWSYDWAHWPPQNMLAALNELRTGVSWAPPPDSLDAAFADGDREWARTTIERTGQDADTLAQALASDIGRAAQAVDRYYKARQAVMAAIRRGRLQVWACRASAFGKPDYAAVPELLPPRLFTHEPREVNEGAWVCAVSERDHGPWWDRVRFDRDSVLVLWPKGNEIAGCGPLPCPFPSTDRLAPWLAVCWRAFGALEAPEHLLRHRSFDGGAERLPDETSAGYEVRRKQHQDFDVAEREVMDLLAAGRVKAVGLPPAALGSHASSRVHVAVPANAFLNQQSALAADGSLIARLPSLDRLFPPLNIRGSEASPEYPLWHDLLIDTAGLREAWGDAQTLPSPSQTSLFPASVPLPQVRKRPHTGRDWRADDAVLVKEMRCLIADNKAPSATNAARAVVNQAKGVGSEDSRVARLVKLYGETYPVV